MSVILGGIADDFTGATDLANTLVKNGMKAVQVIGVPETTPDLGDAEAVIVALKSRTAPVAEAMASSLAALDWLSSLGARQFFFKYCSTFDSTAEGNIGPVADALLDALELDFAIACPAFPENGRTVYQGHLFVGETLLSDSPMKDHPLTPMRDANLSRLLSAQTQRSVGLINWSTVRSGADKIAASIEELRSAGTTYGIVDAITDDDLMAIGRAVHGQTLITGGSAVAMGLPDNYRAEGLLGPVAVQCAPQQVGRALVIAGSCSKATREQISRARDIWPSHKIEIDAIAAGEPVVEQAIDWILEQNDSKPALVYGSADPVEVAKAQATYGREAAGEMMERTLAGIALCAVQVGVCRLIVAGGETSGAVVSALGISALRIGPEIAPGVPWTETVEEPSLALALKSGNFGSPDFFSDALELLP